MNAALLQSIGWWGYFGCAVIYVVAGLRAGDWLGLIGSLFFLGATISFLVLHYHSERHASQEGRNS